jgi:hypothetical protein
MPARVSEPAVALFPNETFVLVVADPKNSVGSVVEVN